ncbi:MAG: septum formation protein Maf [Deltaproteobacteria bacterium HGW-Deltaproteobacteria-15]|jgi:septum formation protein|nr:MAG: septum formation protein Maf [Deltaproteobacteria bacterium HGW-Deltaproteobacteria-15]
MRIPTISSTFPLILASASPRRKSLLKQVRLPFRAVPGRIDEGSETGEPAERVRSLAEKKAIATFRKIGDHWVLGADTEVVFDNKVLGKPADRRSAASMLSLLSGKEHIVITGFCILNPSGRTVHSEAVETLVRVTRLTRRQIEEYIATGEVFGKAGSYAIQGIGAFMVQSITGSYTNVVGLPLNAVVRALLKVGALKRFPLSGR